MKNTLNQSSHNNPLESNMNMMRSSTPSNSKLKLSFQAMGIPFSTNRRLKEQQSQNPLNYLLYQGLKEKSSKDPSVPIKIKLPKIKNDKTNSLIQRKLILLRDSSQHKDGYSPKERLFNQDFLNKFNNPMNSLLSNIDNGHLSDRTEKLNLSKKDTISSKGLALLKKCNSINMIGKRFIEENSIIKKDKPKILSLKTNRHAPKPVFRSNMLKGYKGRSQPGKNSKYIKQNQDTFLIMTLIFNIIDFNLFAVFDGHGLNGHFISDFIKNHFKDSLLNNQTLSQSKSIKEIYGLLIENNYNIIRNLFTTAEEELKKLKTVDSNCSGTTAIVVFQIGPHLITANVGDSRAIIVEDKNKAVALSYDHKPLNATERNRIEQSGGRVEQYIENGIKAGPYRVWLKRELQPGLAMSRSIGDLIATPIGVVPDPEIVEYTIHNGSHYIILASDGVWEFIDNSKAAELTMPYYCNNDPSGLCRKLVYEATKYWEKEDGVIDDITVVTAFF